MPKFNTLQKLYNYNKDISTNILKNQIGQRMRDVLFDKTEELLYQKIIESEYYDRTRDLINSITIGELQRKSSDLYEVSVYFDINKLTPNLGVEGKFNQHMDIYGDDMRQYIPEWVEYGHGGIVSKEGVGMVKEARLQLNKANEIGKIFKVTLKQNGFKIK